MKRSLFSVALLAGMVGVMTVTGIAAQPSQSHVATEAPNIHWHGDLKTAHKQAVSEGKPILVVFGAEWCGFCKKLERQTLNTPEMTQYINENFVPVHLDLDKEQKIGAILEVQALPCTVVLSPDADLLGKINGYQTAGPYQKSLAAAREQFRPTQSVVPTRGILR